MRPTSKLGILILTIIAITCSLASATPAAAAGASFTLVPDNITPDGNGLINDLTIEVSGGQVSASGSGTRNWMDSPGASTAQITGTYDAASGAFKATYSGQWKGTRQAGDIVQDVIFTFTGEADTRVDPNDSNAEIYFKGTLTNEVKGGPSQPPVQTLEHSLGGMYTVQGYAPAEAEASSGAEKPATSATSKQPADSSAAFPIGAILIGAVTVGVIGVGIAVATKVFGGASAGATGAQPAATGAATIPDVPSEPEPDDDAGEAAEEDEEDEKRRVVLELTYPAGRSPRVFTSGWVFGARCTIVTADGDETDLSDSVEWSGTGEFNPSTGHRSRPIFADEGANSIVLTCDVDGRTVKRTFTVDAVSPANYASIGTYAVCDADSHGCPGCPHVVVGRVQTGSSLVTVNGRPAARAGDSGKHAMCCGPNTFVIGEGDSDVLIQGRPAAKIGDRTDHCGGVGSLRHTGQVGEIARNMWEDAPS